MTTITPPREITREERSRILWLTQRDAVRRQALELLAALNLPAPALPPRLYGTDYPPDCISAEWTWHWHEGEGTTGASLVIRLDGVTYAADAYVIGGEIEEFSTTDPAALAAWCAEFAAPLEAHDLLTFGTR